MKTTQIFLILLLISETSYSQIKFKIECTILNVDTLKEASIFDFDEINFKSKNIPIIDNKFTIEGEAKCPSLVVVGADNVGMGLGLWATSGNYKATFYVKDNRLQPFKIVGSQEASDYLLFLNQQNGLSSIEKDFLKRNTLRAQNLEDFVKSHTNSYLSSFFLTQAFDYCNYQKIKELFYLLPENIRNSDEGKRLTNEIIKAEQNEVGKVIDDFELPDINNQRVKASKFIDSYTIIDFWAPSCAPCRVSNKELADNQSLYDKKTVKLLSISLDKDINIWKKAIEKDGMNWTQLIDIQGFNSLTSKKFKITGIPYMIMVDKQMKIVATGKWDIYRFVEKL